MRLWRAHGLGNDYLVVERGPALTPSLAAAVCNRHTGVGSDGLLEPFDTDDADYGVRIWNPDGSVAEKSGNGLRIYARWLVETRGAPACFTVHTGAEGVSCEVGAEAIRIAMGAARFRPEEVPVIAERPVLDGPLQLADRTLAVVAVGVGNPHCVVFGPDFALPWRQLGAEIEAHPRFPNRTNVQFARIVDRTTVEIRIWERGAGETPASGSSSCAVAAAGVETGRLDSGDIAVQMPGGRLDVRVGTDRQLWLTGPVEVVGAIEVDPRWLQHRS